MVIAVGGFLGLLLAPFSLIYSVLKARGDATARRWPLFALGLISIVQSICALACFVLLLLEMRNSGV
jgi:hypothetical protein